MTSRKATFYCSKTTHFVFILYNTYMVCMILQFWHRFDRAASTMIIFTKCPSHISLSSSGLYEHLSICYSVCNRRTRLMEKFVFIKFHTHYEWVASILQASHSVLYGQENTFPHINGIYGGESKVCVALGYKVLCSFIWWLARAT